MAARDAGALRLELERTKNQLAEVVDEVVLCEEQNKSLRNSLEAVQDALSESSEAAAHAVSDCLSGLFQLKVLLPRHIVEGSDFQDIVARSNTSCYRLKSIEQQTQERLLSMGIRVTLHVPRMLHVDDNVQESVRQAALRGVDTEDHTMNARLVALAQYYENRIASFRETATSRGTPTSSSGEVAALTHERDELEREVSRLERALERVMDEGLRARLRPDGSLSPAPTPASASHASHLPWSAGAGLDRRRAPSPSTGAHVHALEASEAAARADSRRWAERARAAEHRVQELLDEIQRYRSSSGSGSRGNGGNGGVSFTSPTRSSPPPHSAASVERSPHHSSSGSPLQSQSQPRAVQESPASLRGRLDALRAEQASLRHTVHSLRRELSAAERKAQDATEAARHDRDRTVQAEEHAEKEHRKNAHLEERLQKVYEEMWTAERDRDDDKARAAKMQTEKDELQRLTQSRETELARCRQQLEQAEQRAEEKESEVARVRAEMKNLSTRLDDAQYQLEAREAEVNALREDIKVTEQRLSNASGELYRVTRELEETNSRNSFLEESHSSLESRCSALQSQLNDRDESVKSLQESLSEKERELARMSESCQSHENRVESLRGDLEAVLDRAESELEARQAAEQHAEELRQQLANREHWDSRVDQLVRGKEAAEARVQSQGAALDDARREEARARSEVERYAQRVTGLQTTLQSLRVRCDDAEAAAEAARQREAVVRRAAQHAEAEAASFRRQLEEVAAARDRWAGKCAELEAMRWGVGHGSENGDVGAGGALEGLDDSDDEEDEYDVWPTNGGNSASREGADSWRERQKNRIAALGARSPPSSPRRQLDLSPPSLEHPPSGSRSRDRTSETVVEVDGQSRVEIHTDN